MSTMRCFATLRQQRARLSVAASFLILVALVACEPSAEDLEAVD